MIVGVATEAGIEPTVRDEAGLGYFSVIFVDACGGGHEEAAKRSIESLTFSGDPFVADTRDDLRHLAEQP
jgi:nicotinamidase-related amidase